MSEGEGYLDEIAYVPGFYGNLAPTAIRFATALNGSMPPRIEDGFDYLELGCGTGLALNLLAEANPEGRFVGVDFLAEHVAEGRRVAAAGGLGNVGFIQRAFGDLLQESLPRFDFITMHGVWAWVSPAVREEILAIVRALLKPGGLVLVSYNAMPGWAPVRPIRDILYAHGARREGAPLERVRAALDYLVFLKEHNAPYFAENPAAKDFVDSLLDLDLRYLAHEYFQDHWSPQAFADVAQAYAGAGTAYVGSLPLHTNFRDLCVKPEFQDLLASAPDRLILEVHKDLIANTAFRWDIYGTARAAGPDDEPFDGFHFVRTRQTAQFPFRVRFGSMEAELAGAVYETLYAAVGRGGVTYAELAGTAEADGMEPADLRRTLGIMVAGRLLDVQPRPALPEVTEGPLALGSALNRHLMEQLPQSGRALPLASRQSGTAYPVGEVDAMVLRELLMAGRDGLAERIMAWMNANGRNIRRGTEVVPDEEALPVISKLCADVERNLVPQLRRRGILTGG